MIQAAYKRLAWKYHPDRNPARGDESLMKTINEAYEVLSDPDRRAEYDAGRSASSADNRETESTNNPIYEVVVCPNCGQKNRIRWNRGRKRALCGSCGEELPACGDEEALDEDETIAHLANVLRAGAVVSEPMDSSKKKRRRIKCRLSEVDEDFLACNCPDCGCQVYFSRQFFGPGSSVRCPGCHSDFTWDDDASVPSSAISAGPDNVKIASRTVVNPFLAAALTFLCLPGLGQIAAGQVGKGIAIFLGLILLMGPLHVVTAGTSLLFTLIAIAIDAFMVADKLRSGKSVDKWTWFPP